MSYQYLSGNEVTFPVSTPRWRLMQVNKKSVRKSYPPLCRFSFCFYFWQVTSWRYWHSFLNCFCEAGDTLTPHANTNSPPHSNRTIKYQVLILSLYTWHYSHFCVTKMWTEFEHIILACLLSLCFHYKHTNWGIYRAKSETLRSLGCYMVFYLNLASFLLWELLINIFIINQNWHLGLQKNYTVRVFCC